MKNEMNPGMQERPAFRPWLEQQMLEFRLLTKSVPSVMLILFMTSVFLMNLLANKSINLPFSWLALDCGLVVSWFAFLTMDIITKHFGPKAATQLSIFAMLLNLGLCGVFWLVSRIPGTWSASFVPGSEAVINSALDATFGGTWYVILGSAVAFGVSSVVNNFLNAYVGRAFTRNPNGMAAYLCRSYVSTAVGQFTDNFVFAMLVSHVFFGWTLVQCITCSLFGMVVELLCEGLFSVFGYMICQKWRTEKVGEEYLKLAHSGV